MVDDKKIDNEAVSYTQDGYNDYSSDMQDVIKESFKSGAEWAINEFLKDLWHPMQEEPKEFKEILAEVKLTESINTYLSFKRNDALFKNWAVYSSGANITRWLYVEDLLPKTQKGDDNELS